MKSERVKVLHPLLGRPLGTYPIARALEVSASPVVVVVGHQAEAVQAAMEPLFAGRGLVYALQREQRGTADAVRAARGQLAAHEGPILILYGDAPLLRAQTLSALLAAYRAGAGPLALVTTVAKDPTGYGRVLREGGQVVRVVEQKDCTSEQARVSECNAGIYVVDAQFLWRALAEVRDQNAQGELYLTDLVEMAARQRGVAAVEADFAEVAGVNDRAELAACARAMQERINLRHLKAGVTLEDGASTFIHEDVQIGPDTEIGPQVSLRAGCIIGAGVRIGQGCVLSACRVGDGTELKPYSVLEEAEVGPGCIIGPFARLRPGTQLAEGVHIGNFVETKKARIGKGSKANHLTYLGDAVVGAGVNVGAGTITCNYDGVNKHVTELGDNVFIGSDTQLVAPVKVGEGAYVGAGTTVTKDVPPMSLAVSRAPQVVKEGWVARKKAKAMQSR